MWVDVYDEVICDVICFFFSQATNVQLVSYSASIIRHVSALLLISSPRSCIMMEASSYALDILFHIGNHVDITGTRRMKKALSETWMTNPFEIQGLEKYVLVVPV